MKNGILAILFLLCAVVSAQDKYIKDGDKLMERQEFLDALEKYQISYFYNADYISTQRIAQAYFQLQRFKDAINWYSQAVKSKDATWQDFYWLSKSAIVEREFDVALNAINRAIGRNKTNRELPFVKMHIEELAKRQSVPERAKTSTTDYCIDINLPADPQQVGSQIQYEWFFDDGTFKKGNHVEHCFDRGGKHTVKLTSVDNSFNILTKNDTTLELYFFDETNFRIEGIGWVNSAVKYDASNTVDGDVVAAYLWETGDGNILFSNSCIYKYVKPGQYKVKLTIFFKDSNNTVSHGGSISKTWLVVNR